MDWLKRRNTHIHQDSVHVNVWSAQIKVTNNGSYDKNAQLFEDGKPDFGQFLSNPNNNIMHCNIEAGDILFVPYKWWHRAETLEESISLNTFYITEIIKQNI